MVSSFLNPGFPPVHTHPPTFSAMVAANEVSLRETVDALFAPYLAKIRRARELALSDGGVSDPAPMISDDATAIDPGHKTIPRVAASTDSVPPLLLSSPLLRALANPPVKPQSNSNASMANSPNQPLHSNDFVAATFPLRNVEKTRPVVMVTTAPLFPISRTFSTESSHAHNHKPVLSTKEATTMVHVLGFPLRNAEATKSVGLSHTNTTKRRHEVLRSLIYNLSHGKAKWHWLLQFILAYYLGDILVIYEDFLTKNFGWINWYIVGKFLMKDLCASNMFVEMSKRQSTEHLSWNSNLGWSVALGSPCTFARDVEKPGSQFHMQEICEVFPINATHPMVVVEIVSYIKTSCGFRSLNTLGVQYLKEEVKKRFCKNECKSKKNTEENHIWDTVLMNFKSGRAVHEELAKYGDLENQVFCKWTYLGHAHMQLNNETDSREMEACGCDDDLLEEIVLGDLVDGLHAKIGCRVAFPSHLTLTAAKELGLVAGIPVETSLIAAHVGGVRLLESVPITDSEPKECYVPKLKGHGVLDTITDKLGTSSTHGISTSENSFNKRKEMYGVHVDFIPFWNATLMDKGKKKKSPEEAQKVVGNMNDAAASAIKIKEMEQGLTSLIVLGSGRLSDLIAQLQDILEGVNEADILPEKFDSAVIRAQIQQLAREFWELTSSGPVTIYNENSSSSGNCASYLVPVAALAAMGYCFHDFIFTILVSDERSHSADCDFQWGYHMPISDTGGTLHGLLTLNVQTKDAHRSKFLICTGKFMKNGTIMHLKLGFHEFILDKGGTAIQRLLNSKSTGKVEIILVQENAFAQLFDALQPLEEVDLLIVPADQTRIAPNVFVEIPDSSCCVVVHCGMCYCKGIRNKGGGSKSWYTVVSNTHFSCLNESGNSIECSQDGMIGVVMLVAYTTCIVVGGVFCSTYIALSRVGKMTFPTVTIENTSFEHIQKLGDLSLLVENTSVEQLGLVRKVTIFKDSTTIIGDAASKDGLQVHGGSPFDIMGRNLFWEKQLQRLQIGACYAEASN